MKRRHVLKAGSLVLSLGLTAVLAAKLFGLY